MALSRFLFMGQRRLPDRRLTERPVSHPTRTKSGLNHFTHSEKNIYPQNDQHKKTL